VFRVVRNLLLLALLGILVMPAAAQASPVSDCAGDGDLDKQYSNAQLRNALDHIPGDLDEYSNCREVIKGAISSGSDKRNDRSGDSSGGGGGGSSSSGSGGGAVSAEEQQARANDNSDLEVITGDKNARPRVNVGGQEVEPGGNGLFDLASASNELPLPLLLALVGIGLLAIAGGLVALRDRVPGLARLPLLSKMPRVSLPRLRR
jgi:hypothetical protein